MQKKMFIIPLMILIISFSAGIFTQIVIPIEGTSLTQDLPSVGTGILDYLKNDMITGCTAFFLQCVSFAAGTLHCRWKNIFPRLFCGLSSCVLCKKRFRSDLLRAAAQRSV